jgi:hypothetical protein
VRHLSDGALRRLYDEPHSLDEQTRAHYNSCQDCQGRFAAVADDARHALALMAVPAATVDPATALRRVKAGTASARPRFSVFQVVPRRPLVGGLAAASVAVVLIGTMAFTPLVAHLVQIFQPTQIQTVTINQGDLTGLDVFSNWGDVKGTKTPELKQVETAAEAAKISGLPEIKVKADKLPASLAKAPVGYAATGQGSGTVTFNGNAPSKLQGSTLTVVVGPAETAIYGDLGKLAQAAGGSSSRQGYGTEGSAPKGEGGAAPTSEQIKNALASAGPILAVAEMRSPQVSSTGVTVKQIKAELLKQNLSPAVKAAINAIDNPSGNLPIPLPAGYVNSHSVTVQGVTGTAFGDNTGLGSAVIWIKHGRAYGVAGTVTEDQVLAVANSLA